MIATVSCPSCGHKFHLPESSQGAEARCPACLNSFPIPSSPPSPLMARSAPAPMPRAPDPANRTILAQTEAMIRYNCPRCKKALESPASFAGQKLNCPDCNQRLQIPLPPIPSAPPINKTILATQEPEAAFAPPSSRSPAQSPPAVPAMQAELVEEVRAAPARRENCLECGVDVTNRGRVQTCPDCGSIFCSASCYREHNHHAHAKKPKRRPRAEECEYCGSTERPYQTSEISQGGWITFALLMVFFFPLFWVGLLMTETRWKCSDCGARLD
jgi:DNA-directed RNA polymerase subunit RPC12/RpoP